MPVFQPYRPQTTVSRGLKLWWPCDDIGSPTGYVREMVQGAHAQPVASPFAGPAGNSHRQPNAFQRLGTKGGALRSRAAVSTTTYYTSGNITFPAPSFSVSFWYTRGSATPSTSYGLVLQAFTTSRFQFLEKNTGVCAWYTNSASEDPTTFGLTAGPGGILTHFVWTYNGTTFNFIQNGVNIRSVAGTGNAAPYSAPVAFCGNGGNYTMRDIRVYDRALNVGEIRQIYAEGFVPDPVEIQLDAFMSTPTTAFMVPSQAVNMRQSVRLIGY